MNEICISYMKWNIDIWKVISHMELKHSHKKYYFKCEIACEIFVREMTMNYSLQVSTGFSFGHKLALAWNDQQKVWARSNLDFVRLT